MSVLSLLLNAHKLCKLCVTLHSYQWNCHWSLLTVRIKIPKPSQILVQDLFFKKVDRKESLKYSLLYKLLTLTAHRKKFHSGVKSFFSFMTFPFHYKIIHSVYCLCQSLPGYSTSPYYRPHLSWVEIPQS